MTELGDQPVGGHINAVDRYSGIDVSVYLTLDAWEELSATGSVDVSRPFGAASPEARVVKVTIHRP